MHSYERTCVCFVYHSDDDETAKHVDVHIYYRKTFWWLWFNTISIFYMFPRNVSVRVYLFGLRVFAATCALRPAVAIRERKSPFYCRQFSIIFYTMYTRCTVSTLQYSYDASCFFFFCFSRSVWNFIAPLRSRFNDATTSSGIIAAALTATGIMPNEPLKPQCDK